MIKELTYVGYFKSKFKDNLYYIYTFVSPETLNTYYYTCLKDISSTIIEYNSYYCLLKLKSCKMKIVYFDDDKSKLQPNVIVCQ